MIQKTILTLVACAISLPALAEEKVDPKVMRDREREAGRCMERAEKFSDMEEFEKRFGWSKEHFGHQRHKLLEKRKAASREWKEAAAKIKQARNHDQINVLKIPAYQAGGEAYLAELELRADSSEKRWKAMAEKLDSDAADKAVRELLENQRHTIEVTKAKIMREQQLRKLAWRKYELSEVLEGEEKKAQDKGDDRRRKPSNTKGRPLKKPEVKPEPERKDPPKLLIE